MSRHMQIAIIGAGNMGGAIADALLQQGTYTIAVSNPTPSKLQRFVQQGAHVTTDNCEAARQADIVVLAVKPWLVESVLAELSGQVALTHKTVISVAAGITGQQLCQWAGPEVTLFSVIPNTAIARRQSVTLIVPVRATAEATDAVCRLFEPMGMTFVTDEAHLAAATALTSCGIAYALRYVRAATEGAVELGMKPAEAQRLVAQTLRGAAALLEPEGTHAETEIDRVTTPGGLTIRGLNAMEQAGFTAAVIAGLKASTL